MAESLKTILVVDYTAAELEAVASVLKTAKFHVLQADGSAKAMTLATNCSSRIDLLLSDLEMPVMSGPNLGDELRKTRPDLQMMFISRTNGSGVWVFDLGWAHIERSAAATKLPEMVHNVFLSPSNSRGNNPYNLTARADKLEKMTFKSYAVRW